MRRKFLAYLSFATLLAMAASLPLVLHGAQSAIASMFNAPVRWIPPESDSLRAFREYIEQFDVHELILISWPGCTIDDERLKALAEEVERVRQQRWAAGEPELFAGTPNGYETLRELTEVGIPRRAAVSRLENVLIGPDGETTCAAFELTPLGAEQREQALQIILKAADATVNLPRAKYRLAGPPIDGMAIDLFSVQSIQTFAVPSAVLSFLLCWLCLRSLWFTLPVVAVAALGQGVALAALYYSGATMNAVLIVLPPLVFVLTISAGIHLVNYYYEALREGRKRTATAHALAKGWRPGMLAAVTTAFGLGSLLVSDVEPVRQFGVLGAFVVLLTMVLLFLLLPGAMQWWPGAQRFLRKRRFTLRRLEKVGGKSVWVLLTAVMRRWNGLLTVVALLALIGFGWGLTRVTTTLDVVSLLSPETRAVEDHHWFQEHVTPLVPVEVIVRFDGDNPLDLVERAAFVTRVHAEARQVELVEGAISAITFMPPLPRGSGFRATTQRAVYESRLRDRLGDLAAAGYIRSDGEAQLWRVSGRVTGRGDIDYRQFLDRLRERIDPLLEEPEAESIEITYTGVTSAVYEVQRALLADLFNSFLTAILLVSCVMVFILRSLWAALVAMIPNIFPPLILFGSMGWMGWSVDIGSLMTASVALGIAVDGTFHFLATYKRELLHGHGAIYAIHETYRHCGRALLQTALICAAGMLTFTSSNFLPARSFAWMLVLLLMIATVGDLIVLPALLASPLGRWFLPPPNAHDPLVSDDPPTEEEAAAEETAAVE
ncbi:efflux RND transporter permease subunit [Candidatus Laterigemmans baculatus]|uniref:efflux RND transporter permease subunit n=1 Tax=Candidatus Laterigemmans baculatus TaxID=2770505 RepID=UPI0013DAE319|nr:efflux RND transporter permease subunit [Candidatus Laterigemmans baculatus]